MKSMEKRKDELVQDIMFMRNATPEQIRKITFDGLSSYFNALRAFGFKSPVPKEALKVIRDMYKVSKIEGKLLDFILINLDHLNIDSAEETVDELDQLNTTTYLNYNEVLDEIDVAAQMHKEERALHPNRKIDSLLTNNKYKTKVFGLVQRFSDVKNFLNYDEDFWEFVSAHLK